MKILLIDNYDSFTYNLFHYLEDMECEVTVVRNDSFDLEDVSSFDKIVLSPGPGLPKEAGLMNAVIDRYYQTKPILGICLGMQALAEYFGGKLYNQVRVKHGISEICTQTYPSMLFSEVPTDFTVGLYHSWAIDIANNAHLRETSLSENQILMSLEHHTLPIFGVQFHPESILTPHGKQILRNFIAQ